MLLTALSVFRRSTLGFLACALFVAGSAHGDHHEISLFDGKTLSGWSGEDGLWKVVDGAIVGNTGPDGRKGNTFLVYEKPFGDFVLEFDYKLISGNSGVQIRSAYHGDPSHHVIAGYQADIGAGYFGSLYDEKRRGMLAQADGKWVAPFLKKNDWNHYEVRAQGNRIALKINGLPTAEYIEKDDNIPRSGLIALQLHGGGSMEVQYKNLRLREIKKSRVLYVTTAAGFAHSSRPLSREVVEKIGIDSGEFVATTTDSTELITPEGLKNFDLVLFYTTGDLKKFPLTEENRNALIEWVKAGNSFAGVHSATDTYKDWQPYWEMIGGSFAGHPWHEDVQIDVEDPSHPAALPIPKGWVIKDEIYQFRNYSRNRLHIILSMNTKSEKGKSGRKDRDVPIAWCREFGKGRVFYTSLGHREDVWTNPIFQAHLLGGLGWALGRPGYDGDATPGLPKPSNQWVNLFDESSLSGWTPNELAKGEDTAVWTNNKGIVKGSAQSEKKGHGHLFSPRSYRNFHYRAEIKVGEGGNSGMYFRTQKGQRWPKGFEAQINSTHGDRVRTGSLYYINKVFTQEAKPDTWFTQEVIAYGDHIVIKVNGKVTTKVKIPAPGFEHLNYKEGHFAFQFHDPACRVELRNVMVRELPSF